MADKAQAERERILAILEAHQHLIDERLYIRLANAFGNPDHDPRTIPDEELPLMGYWPVPKNKPVKKKARRKK